jgi:hypothetical protein
MEYWSGGKEKGLECWPPVRRAFTFLTLVMRDPDMVYIFSLYLKGAVSGSGFKVQRL